MQIKHLKVCMFGTGYVGLVSGTCFAEMGHQVICCDSNKEKISLLKQGKIPIYEPGLEEIVLRNVKRKRLSFFTADEVDLSDVDLAVIAVGTPNGADGKTDISFVNAVVDFINQRKHPKLTVMVKSTVPLGTCKSIFDKLNKGSNYQIDVVSNPEFLREGSAVKDFLEPERVVLGFFNKDTGSKLNVLYHKIKNKTTILHTDCSTSELIKYASNAFLSAKVAFINEMSHICEKIDADVEMLSMGMGLDSRIGGKFLSPGPGFGGSCFPKDVRALKSLTDAMQTNNRLISSIEQSNNDWKKIVASRIMKIAKKHNFNRIHFLGVTYKANTDDVRSSAVIDIIDSLKNEFEISCYDPEGLKNLEQIFANDITYNSEIYSINNALIVVATEWKQFNKIDYRQFQDLTEKVIFDLRNIIDYKAAKSAGFKLYRLGQK
ncbi:MAG: UDP-glucose/GDP-mannose dehydrogenase family protein [Rickettsiales bacterium]